MSDTAIAISNLSFTDYLASNLDLTTGTSVTSGNVGVLTAPAGDTANLIFCFYNASGGATVTFEAGDEPPSENSGLGNPAAVTLTATKAGVLVVEGGRFVQSDGTIRVDVADNTVVFNVLRLPLGM